MYNKHQRTLSLCVSSCAKENVLLSVFMMSLWFPFCFGKDGSTTCRTVNLLPSQGGWSVAFIGCKQGNFLPEFYHHYIFFFGDKFILRICYIGLCM